MKKKVDVVVVIPVGPACKLPFIMDTIESYIHYKRKTYQFIIADDSHRDTGKQLKTLYPGIDVVCTPRPMGREGGLYITLSLAYRHAVHIADFSALLRLDTDALVIGKEPESMAIELFASNPRAGIAGQYPLDYNGNQWNKGWPNDRIINGTTTWKFIRRPMANWALRGLYQQALQNGYKTGESVFGGAYFVSPLLLQALYQKRLLPDYKLKTLRLEEDHIFSLLTKAEGFTLEDLSSGNRPFACSWRGLPASPQQLHDEGKKIIHSTRKWEQMTETEIREWFREERRETAFSSYLHQTNHLPLN